MEPNEIKARKTSTDKSGGSQDERSISSNTSQHSKPSLNETKSKSSQQQPQITSKVAQAISAVKAKVIPPKDKPKQDAPTSSGKKNSVISNAPSVGTEVKVPSDKPKQSYPGSTMKEHISNTSISNTSLTASSEFKSLEEKQQPGANKSKQLEDADNFVPISKPTIIQPNTQQPLQINNQTNRLVAEVKPMQSSQPVVNVQKQTDETQATKQNVNEEELRNETVKRAAEKFEKETIQSYNRGRSGGAFGAYRERSKSIGHSLGQKISTDIEDVDYDEDYGTTSSSMLPWANDNNIGKSSTPAVVRKRNSMRGMGAYQLRMSKSSDSITAAKMLAEARMQDEAGSQDKDGHARGRPNYHQQKALRINAQNYGGAGGRGEMSKSIEKQIDVYTKTREDIRRILDVAKKCSVAQRVQLLDNQQVDAEAMLAIDADRSQVETTVGTQTSGVLKSRYESDYCR